MSDGVLSLKIELTHLNDYQVMAHIKFDGDELAICTVAAQLIADNDSANEFRRMCLSIVQRYIAKISGEVVTIMEDQ